MAIVDQAVVQFWKGQAQNAPNTVEKGKAFQNLATYVFRRVPGVHIAARNSWNSGASQEYDIAFFNSSSRLELGFLDYVFLLECKYQSRRVSAPQVSWFGNKLRSRALRDGVIVSRLGLSGDPTGPTGAYVEVRNARLDGLRIIGVCLAELEAIASTADLVNLCRQKWTKLVLGP